MKIKDLMSKNLSYVEMDSSLKEVKRVFDNVHFHHLLVVDKGYLVGIISDRDLLKAISPRIGTAAETTRDLNTLNKRAHQIMTRWPVTLSPDNTLLDAVNLFDTKGVSCLPVVEDKKPVGIVSWRDLMSELNDSRKH